MPKSAVKPQPEPTDLVTYKQDNPEFWLCHRRHLWIYAGPMFDQWAEVEGEPGVTHEIVATCSRCGEIRREKALAYLDSKKKKYKLVLPTTYVRPEGFALVGVRLSPRDVKESALDDLLEAARPKPVRRKPPAQLNRRVKVVPAAALKPPRLRKTA